MAQYVPVQWFLTSWCVGGLKLPLVLVYPRMFSRFFCICLLVEHRRSNGGHDEPGARFSQQFMFVCYVLCRTFSSKKICGPIQAVAHKSAQPPPQNEHSILFRPFVITMCVESLSVRTVSETHLGSLQLLSGFRKTFSCKSRSRRRRFQRQFCQDDAPMQLHTCRHNMRVSTLRREIVARTHRP